MPGVGFFVVEMVARAYNVSMFEPRSILHIDMDAYYASVEEREQPGLAGRPLVVGGSPQGRGVVAAANYAARQYGIHSAMPVSRALRLCPALICLPVQMDRYVRVSQQIREIFARYTPLIEPLSLDEAFLDVSDSIQLFGAARDIARRIKREIRDELSLVASVGVAPNKYLAKIASDVDKPDGFIEVTAQGAQAFLDPLPASRVWGVGKATNKELARLGITTIGQLRMQSREVLVERFGQFGTHLWQLVRGIDERPVVRDSEAKSISNETTFVHNVADNRVLRAWLMDLSEQVGRRLRAHQRFGRTVQLKVRFEDFHTITRSHTLPQATQSTRQIWQAAQSLLAAARQSDPRPVRLIGVGISSLGEGSVTADLQQDMFASMQQPLDSAKQQQIDELADNIQLRFGKSAIKRATGIRRRDR